MYYTAKVLYHTNSVSKIITFGGVIMRSLILLHILDMPIDVKKNYLVCQELEIRMKDIYEKQFFQFFLRNVQLLRSLLSTDKYKSPFPKKMWIQKM